uniref:Proline and serine rich coiled-coil 1 n=1 Tax=Rhinolophus ferrumequinum TaxID=59479 RepID=A0A671FWX7_RHIFE
MGDLQEDVKFIVDETLDFGGLSPSDSREEEDIAVLVTSEKPLRRGLSHRSDPNAVAPTPQGLRFSLGRLSPEKLEEILDEANRLAAQLEQCALQEQESTGAGSGPRRVKPSPRRETFVLKDSPVRDLLPTVSSLARSTPSPSSLPPRLRSSDKKGSVRAFRATSGKRPSSVKRESPTCNLFPTSKSPASSPLSRSTPPIRGKAGPHGRATASEKTWAAKLWVSGSREDVELTLKFLCCSAPGPPTPVVRPVLAPQPSTSNSQRPSRPQGVAAKPSSRLPAPSAIPRPASQVPLTSRSIPPSKGALAPDSLSTRKGLPRPSTTGHRVRKNGHKVPVSQRPNLSVTGTTRSNLQPPRKVAVAGPTR